MLYILNHILWMHFYISALKVKMCIILLFDSRYFKF